MDLEVEEIVQRLSNAMKHGGVPELATQVQAERKRLECVTVHVAVAGTSRVGKSSFINSVTGFKEGEDGAAGTTTGAAEQGAKPACYGRSGHPNAVFWELPNIERVDFSPKEYLQAVGGAAKYVGFFIITSTEFCKGAVALAAELKQLGKPFFFIRSKIDRAAHYYKDEEFAKEVLHRVSMYNFENLDLEYAIARLFYVSCHEQDKFDFLACIQAMQKNSSPALQKHALMVSLNYLANKLELRISLRALVPLSAIHSCVIEPLAVEQLAYEVNVCFLCDEIRSYRVLLGLDYPALNKCAKLIGRPTFVLADVIQTQMARELTEKNVVGELAKWTERHALVGASNATWTPLLELLPGGKLSGAATIQLLDTMLAQFTDDAYRVERKMADVLRGE